MNDTMKSIADNIGGQARSAMEQGRKATEEMVAFSKGNVEALIESAKIAAAGMGTMANDGATFARKSFEDTQAAFTSLAGAGSPAAFLKIQGDLARGAFDSLVAEASRSTEATLKLAGEVAAPIQNRLALAADKLKKVA